MKHRIALIFLCCVLVSGACKSHPDGAAATGKPVPAFLGDVPEDRYLDESDPGVYGGQLVIALPANPKTFNPVTAASTTTLLLVGNVIYKALTDFDNKEQTDIPSLAKSWESSPDGLIWTMHLRKGVRWSDGEPFDADDVVFDFQLTFDPNIPAAAADSFVQSDGSYPRVEKADDYTVRFHLKEPNSYFIAALNDVYLVPRHKLEGAYKAGTFAQSLPLNTDPKDVVGLGPYRLVSFTPDQRVVVERNPYYWKVDKKGQRLPYIDRVTFLIVPDNNTWALKMENGEIDMHYFIQPTSVEQIKQDEKKANYTVYDLGPSLAATYLAFNRDTGKNKEGKPRVDPIKLRWFSDVKFRQAVSFAIDREAMARTVFAGHAVPAYNFESPANKVWYTDDIPKYPHNPDKARDLLKEIGITDRKGNGVLEDSDGNPIKFNLYTNANNDVRVNTGNAIKDSLSKIGIEVNFQPIDLNVFHTMLESTHDFDAAIGNWDAAVPPDPVGAKNVILSNGSLHVSFANQKEPGTDWERKIDEDINLVSRTADLPSRQKYYWEAMRLWSEYLPEIELCIPEYFVAAKNIFGNFKPAPLRNYTYWNIDELYFTK
ncbi:MAG TPA: ABC transporter substrate-binding protein [Blastocatellia bacterium]|nr:ABC transporter substrate-binding protein [Blastocatellia bacterium]